MFELTGFQADLNDGNFGEKNVLKKRVEEEYEKKFGSNKLDEAEIKNIALEKIGKLSAEDRIR
jgi:ribosomal protein RSM22 (predicted rRNA methylase)